ncbi:MAG TPA: HYR domain-containing protein [Thermomicrobiales bacterium]|nr:HYR domain-containing protein [Thermomicrobiales bacterium]
MDSNQFDRLSKLFGARKTRRQSLTVMAGAAAAAVGFGQSANAGTLTCVITCPSDDYWNTDTNSCTATGTLPSPTSNGLCGSQAIICNLAGNVTLPLGPNTVSCQTIDSASSCSFTVNVYDDNPPIATCPANISETADGPMAVTFPDATVATMCGTDNFAIDCDHNSGDVFPLGTTTVTCSVIFPSGGFEPTGCSFTVTLAPAPPTETATDTPTEIPATEDPATTVPEPTDTEVPATEVPATVVPATNVPAPTATTAPVTSLPNTGSGSNDGHGGASKLLPLAVVGAGAAALVRLGLRKPADTPEV